MQKVGSKASKLLRPNGLSRHWVAVSVQKVGSKRTNLLRRGVSMVATNLLQAVEKFGTGLVISYTG